MVGASSGAALMMTGVAVNTSLTDPTASAVGAGAGAGAGKEAVIAAPATEVPTDTMRRVPMRDQSPLITLTLTVTKQTSDVFF